MSSVTQLVSCRGRIPAFEDLTSDFQNMPLPRADVAPPTPWLRDLTRITLDVPQAIARRNRHPNTVPRPDRRS